MSAPAWRLLAPPSTFAERHSRAVSARGTQIVFADGRQLLDGTSGLWNVNLGFGNEAIAAAVAAALRDASYLTLFRYGHDYADRAAAGLVHAAGAERYARVVFSTSGGAANDAVMKLARQYALLRGERARRLVLSLRASYHGLTFGGFSLTGEDLGQAAYGVDQRLVRHVGFDDERDLLDVLGREGDRIAAVVVEPVVGSGAHPLPDAFLAALLAGRREHGYLVVADEVATGFGRTGTMFAHERWPAAPDLILVSKGLTNGACGAAAIIVSREVCAAFDRADAIFVHAETQAGSPPSCAAILATLAEMRRLDALASARRVARRLELAVARLAADVPAVSGVSGLGCFVAVHLIRPGDERPFGPRDVAATVAATREAGAIVHPGPGCVQLVPGLLSSDEDVDRLVAHLHSGIERHLHGASA